MRHQASHLGSHAQMSLDELEEERRRNEQRLIELETMYQRQKELGVKVTGRSKHNMSTYSGRGSATDRSFGGERKKSVKIDERQNEI